MEGATKFEDLSRDDQIDTFIQHISGNEKEREISVILAVFAACNISNETAEQYELTEYGFDELIDLLANPDGDDWEAETKKWNVLIDTIGTSKMWEILLTPIPYIDEYLEVAHLLEDIRDKLFKGFARL